MQRQAAMVHDRILRPHAAAGCSEADLCNPRLPEGRLLAFLPAPPAASRCGAAAAPAAATARRSLGACFGSGADTRGASTGRPCTAVNVYVRPRALLRL